MSSTAPNSTATLFVALLGLAVSAVADTGTSPAPDSPLQRALESLRTGDYQGAELHAQAALGRDTESPRPWLVIASARQNRRMYAPAVEAYKSYLTSCPSGELRQFVLEQIQLCQQSLTPAAAPQAASAGLSDADKADLAKVEPDTTIESSEHFVVHARNAKLARLLVAHCETTLVRICHSILGGQEFPHSVQVYVWADARDYHANAVDSPEWSSGSFSVKASGGVVSRRIDLTQREKDGLFSLTMLDRVLPHELCHLVTREMFGERRCPLFLNEGLAMLAETQVDNGRLTLAGAALSQSDKPSLESLLTVRRDTIDNAEVFYAEAYSLTEFLHTRLPARQFRDFLDNLRDGCTVADALGRAMYVAPDEDALLASLATSWQDRAIQQAQFTRALMDK